MRPHPHPETARRLAGGIEDHIERLRAVDPWRRAGEVLLVVGLAVAGAALVLMAGAAAPWSGPVPRAGWADAAGVLLLALSFNAAFLLLHEGMHGMLARGERRNRWASFLGGLPLLVPASAYRVLHVRHHRDLGGPDDPEDYRNLAGPHAWLLQWVRLLLGVPLYLVAIPLLGLRYGASADRRRILLELLLIAAALAAAVALLPTPLLLRLWLLPALAAGVLTSLRGFAQHGLTDPDDPHANARTMRPNRVVAALLLHENHHLEHHLFPDVPSHHLPRLHALLWPRLPRAVTGRSYAALLGGFVLRSLRGDGGVHGLREHPAHPRPAATAPHTPRHDVEALP